MSIDPISTTPLSGETADATPGSSALGKDTFLMLLVTQLEHQDPLDPQDNSAFLAQLAQFSSLESLQSMQGDLSALREAIETRVPVLPDDPASDGGA